MNKDGRAAFPTPPIILDDASVGVIPDSDYHGMTMRQAYKMAALHGLVAHSGWAKDARMDFHRYLAEQAGSIANAMLAEDLAHEKEGEDER